MIFVTIGSQEPFDRLLSMMDEIASSFKDVPILAQVSDRSKLQLRHITAVSFIAPAEFAGYLAKADLIISHAGMGTIINVLELEKPLIVFPRLGRLHETRDDHQVATAQVFEKQGLVHVANNKEELEAKIRAFFEGKIKPAPKISHYASPQLLDSIREFIK